jgi:hypothetical protein
VLVLPTVLMIGFRDVLTLLALCKESITVLESDGADDDIWGNLYEKYKWIIKPPKARGQRRASKRVEEPWLVEGLPFKQRFKIRYCQTTPGRRRGPSRKLLKDERKAANLKFQYELPSFSQFVSSFG